MTKCVASFPYYYILILYIVDEDFRLGDNVFDKALIRKRQMRIEVIALVGKHVRIKKLIEKNEFNNIFSSVCDDFIFYQCNGVEDVKPDVLGRHSIAHCWYNTYPSRKMALNAILFTDFLLIFRTFG